MLLIAHSKKERPFGVLFDIFRYAILFRPNRIAFLFYCHNLCQISWLIYIKSLIGRYIISQQL